jgi:ABC-type amino acid transport substrate-binding protein
MPKIFAQSCIGFLLMISTLPGCGDFESKRGSKPNEQTTGASLKGTKLTVITSADNPPFESHDSANNQIKGFDIDLIRMIAKELEAELVIEDQDFSALIPSLGAKKADFAIAGLAPTEDRMMAVDFSAPYIKGENALLVLEDSGIKGPEYLEGKKLGAQLGSTQAEIASQISLIVKDTQTTHYNKINEIAEEVKSGRIAAGIMEKTVAENFSHIGTRLSVIPLDPKFSQPAAIALPKGSALKSHVDAALQKLEADGRLEHLRKKWFGH